MKVIKFKDKCPSKEVIRLIREQLKENDPDYNGKSLVLGGKINDKPKDG